MSVVAYTCIFHAFRLGLLWMEVRVGVCLITFVLDALFCEIMNWRKCLQGHQNQTPTVDLYDHRIFSAMGHQLCTKCLKLRSGKEITNKQQYILYKTNICPLGFQNTLILHQFRLSSPTQREIHYFHLLFNQHMTRSHSLINKGFTIEGA